MLRELQKNDNVINLRFFWLTSFSNRGKVYIMLVLGSLIKDIQFFVYRDDD